MRWKREYELGIPIIDTQHKQLFRFSDELQSAMGDGLKTSAIDALLKEIKQYVARHFAMEEKYMAEVSYPGMDQQITAHNFFKNRFDEIHTDFQEKGLSPALVNRIKKELMGWINTHITGLDQEFGTYYLEHH